MRKRNSNVSCAVSVAQQLTASSSCNVANSSSACASPMQRQRHITNARIRMCPFPPCGTPRHRNMKLRHSEMLQSGGSGIEKMQILSLQSLCSQVLFVKSQELKRTGVPKFEDGFGTLLKQQHEQKLRFSRSTGTARQQQQQGRSSSRSKWLCFNI